MVASYTTYYAKEDTLRVHIYPSKRVISRLPGPVTEGIGLFPIEHYHRKYKSLAYLIFLLPEEPGILHLDALNPFIERL